MLWKYREQINPAGCDELEAIRVRGETRELQKLAFLFSCYRPGAYGFEVFECGRRIFMTGILGLLGKGSSNAPAIVGILVSLFTIVVFENVKSVLQSRGWEQQYRG